MYCSNLEHKSENVSDTKSESAADHSTTITIDGREFTTFRTFFSSRQKAADAGYLPKSYWNRQQRDAVDVVKPVLVVAKSWRTYRPADADVILAYSQTNEYLVSNHSFYPDCKSRGCWHVFCKDETQPKTPVIKERKKNTSVSNSSSNPHEEQSVMEEACQKSSAKSSSISLKKDNNNKTSFNNNYTSSLISSSYDGENTIISDGKCSGEKDLQQNDSRTRLIRKRAGRDVEVYVPEGFDWSCCPELDGYRSSVMWFFHKLYERRFVNLDGVVHGKDDFITIKTAYARKIDPQFRTVVKVLLDIEIMERDCYQPGSKSYGYRFSDPKLRRAKRRRVPLDDSKLAARIDKHRKELVTTRGDRWLRSHLFKLGLAEVDEKFLTRVAKFSVRENGGCLQDKLEAYQYVLERIGKQEHSWKADDQGRRYSLVTNLKRELRSLLRVNGQQLQQIDVSNSQLTFLALEMRRKGVECPEYFRLCEEGRLYEHVAEHARTNRSKVKEALDTAWIR